MGMTVKERETEKVTERELEMVMALVMDLAMVVAMVVARAWATHSTRKSYPGRRAPVLQHILGHKHLGPLAKHGPSDKPGTPHREEVRCLLPLVRVSDLAPE